MDDMKTIYNVEGRLCKNFVGQISYTVCLEKTYHELDIEFSFSPQRYSEKDVTPRLKKQVADFCEKEYGLIFNSTEEIEDTILHGMKTEIHTLAELNGKFIGCIHRQLATRHMRFTADGATEGCIPLPAIEGVLKVTVLSFVVLLDGTAYRLTVRAR